MCQSRTTTGLVALGALLFLSAPALAADGPVVPLDDDARKELALLGDGVVGKPLPAPSFTDPTPYLNLGEGAWSYSIVAGKEKGKSQEERYEKQSPNRWIRHIGDEYLEYLVVDSSAGIAKVAETALSFGYRSTFDPGMHEARTFEPGETVEIKSKLAVSKDENPDKVEYTGSMNAKITYVGAYQVTVPAGSFEALLLRVDAEIHVGPAKVSDTQYTFFAKGVGKVAEVEAQRVAAVLIYHSKSDTAKLLTAYPKR
ncbi:MAG: hypothetical protein ACQGVK_14340 [Myxococcota bacterium]